MEKIEDNIPNPASNDAADDPATGDPKPISPKRLAANRANAKKSRGPVTSKGREACRTAPLRHGILASTVVLPCESAEDFQDLLRAFIIEFQPDTPAEAALVENLAACRWREMRLWSFERTSLITEISRQSLLNPEFAAEDGATQAATAFNNLVNDSNTVETINRYESRLNRQFDRTLLRLAALQARRHPEEVFK